MSFVFVELETSSHLELAWATCETVALIVGRSRKAPAPASPLPPKTEIPSKSSGLKAAETLRETLSSSAWKGIAVMVVPGLCWVLVFGRNVHVTRNTHKPAIEEFVTLAMSIMIEELFGT